MSSKGIIESFLDSLSLWAAVQDSKDSRGKPDPYKAAGIAFGMKGDLSTADILELGGYLGAEGAFDSSYASDSFSRRSIPLDKKKRNMAALDMDALDIAALDMAALDMAAFDIDQSKSMNWNELNYLEKQRRIEKANRTKRWYRYWNAMWKYEELAKKLSPLETAVLVWEKVSAEHERWPQQYPDYREKFIGWLRKNHDIRMDAEDKMHLIKRKKR